MTAVDAALDELYAQLPDLHCEGYCHTSCGPIRMTRAEHRRVAAAGVPIAEGSIRDTADCVALNPLRQCMVYDVRPLICRLWGLVRAMPCTYGCRPTAYLTDGQAGNFLARAFEISGDDL